MSRRNENRPGYKNTPIGWMPNDWEYSQVGLCCLVRNELRLPLSTEVRKTVQGLYPYYGPTGVLDYIDHYRVEGKYALIAEDGDHFLKYSDKPMTLLVSGKFNVNNHAHLVEGTAKCSTEWFYRYFLHRNICSYTTRQGAGRYKLNKDALMSLPIALPPLPIQNKITQALSTWDNAIEQTRKLIEAKKRRKKALLQQLVTKAKQTVSSIGKWERIRLSSILEPRNEFSNKTKSLPLYSLTIENGITSKTDRYDREFLVKDKEAKKYKVVYQDDIVFNPSNLRWGAIGIGKENYPVLISPIYEVLYVRDISRFNPKVLFEFLSAENQIRLFASKVEGTLVERMAVKLDTFLATKILFPSDFCIQKQIEEIFYAVD